MSNTEVFYIIREEPNGDETVMANTFTTYLDARKELTYNLPAWDQSGEPIKYRIDKALPTPRKLRVHDFTYTELFVGDGISDESKQCTECGCFIPFESGRQVHVTWHNKLLP